MNQKVFVELKAAFIFETITFPILLRCFSNQLVSYREERNSNPFLHFALLRSLEENRVHKKIGRISHYTRTKCNNPSNDHLKKRKTLNKKSNIQRAFMNSTLSQLWKTNFNQNTWSQEGFKENFFEITFLKHKNGTRISFIYRMGQRKTFWTILVLL